MIGLAHACAGPAPTRLNGSAFAPRRVCLDCGGAVASAKAETEFCGDRCRMAFNNRRTKRGAELYDLFMSLRHDRETATVLKVWRLLNRLAAIFREEDRRERAGRRSWRHPSEIIERRPYLKADVLRPGRRRN